jgi:hypothetical protein
MTNIVSISSAPTPHLHIGPTTIEGIEPVLTIAEAAALLPWSYDSVRRYFKDLPGVLVKFQPRRYKRPYKQYMIPQSVFQREWNAMLAHNADNKRRSA